MIWIESQKINAFKMMLSLFYFTKLLLAQKAANSFLASFHKNLSILLSLLTNVKCLLNLQIIQRYTRICTFLLLSMQRFSLLFVLT
jgi:hypothetical protein